MNDNFQIFFWESSDNNLVPLFASYPADDMFHRPSWKWLYLSPAAARCIRTLSFKNCSWNKRLKDRANEAKSNVNFVGKWPTCLKKPTYQNSLWLLIHMFLKYIPTLDNTLKLDVKFRIELACHWLSIGLAWAEFAKFRSILR